MIRLFIALLIPSETRTQLINQCKKIVPDYYSYKWEKKEKIHLTLKFIGDFKEELLSQLLEEINFINELDSFDCEIDKLGFFYKNDVPKILWANLKTENRIFNVVEELNSKLEKFNVKTESRNFKAHLTLLRIKKHPGELFVKAVEESKLKKLNFNSNQIALIKSTLTKQGSIYKDLKVFELK